MSQMRKPTPVKKRPDYLMMIISALIILSVFFFLQSALSEKPVETNYSEISTNLQYIAEYEFVHVGGDNGPLVYASGTFTENAPDMLTKKRRTFKMTISFDQAMTLKNALDAGGQAETRIVIKSSVNFWSILLNILPLAVAVFLLFVILKNAGNANNKAFDFAKNRARLNREKGVTFNDVAGADEEKEELAEIIDFLKNPKKYSDMGARIPKGVLLVGSPGTGKTLLAKAVAGEASVPFFSISGSDFVEMFVGVGASRVRDLFKVVIENSPCIIFIDEIDAVGRQRGAGLGGGHDEREQTLNQLLVEMDGFNPNLGIIIIAATNRPDVLDPALLRPGRFDRQITMQVPDQKSREAILKVHARTKKLDPSIKLSEIAARIPGFTGADIENLLNEAALLAAREGRTVITSQDIDEAADRVTMGPAKKSRKYSPNEKKMVAYHEAGHAVIGLKVNHASVVQKVTIVPRGRAGGYALYTPVEEKFNYAKSELLAMITSALGGRVAEEIIFDDVTTGAYDDFKRATKLARSMVTEYGMSDLGPIQYETDSGNVFLGRDYLKDKNFSDAVALEIDREVRAIITECYELARKVINEHRDLLDNIAKYLIAVETLTKTDIEEIESTGKLAWWDNREANGDAKNTNEQSSDK